LDAFKFIVARASGAKVGENKDKIIAFLDSLKNAWDFEAANLASFTWDGQKLLSSYSKKASDLTDTTPNLQPNPIPLTAAHRFNGLPLASEVKTSPFTPPKEGEKHPRQKEIDELNKRLKTKTDETLAAYKAKLAKSPPKDDYDTRSYQTAFREAMLGKH